MLNHLVDDAPIPTVNEVVYITQMRFSMNLFGSVELAASCIKSI